jgi:hypothetical protein
MFGRLEDQRSLTANQRRIVAAAIIGDMLEFFDYFLIGFVLALCVAGCGARPMYRSSAVAIKCE